MKPLPKIDAVSIFEETQYELISLLKSLSPEEWEYSTANSKWNVKDIAAHLLDGDLRRLSLHRDHHILPEPSGPIRDYDSLVTYLNELNTIWVKAAKRLSPSLIIEITEFTIPKIVNHFQNLDPKGTALFSVGWAGETESENWFDIAREYTEKWYHQQQIRKAADRPLLVQKKWLSPLIGTLVRGIPPVYNKHALNQEAELIEIYISGVIDDRWILTRSKGEWKLYKTAKDEPKTKVEMTDDTAWRVFTKDITEEEALKRIQVSGNTELGSLIAKTVSYMK